MFKLIDTQLFAKISQEASLAPTFSAQYHWQQSASNGYLLALDIKNIPLPQKCNQDKTIIALQGILLLATFTEDGIVEKISIISPDLDAKGASIAAQTYYAIISLTPHAISFWSHQNNELKSETAPWNDKYHDKLSEKLILSFTKERVLSELLMHGLMERYYEHKVATKTSLQAAEALGVEVGQIAKSIVLVNDNEAKAIIVLISGDRKVDLRKVKQLIGQKYRIATASETLAYTGYLVGSVSPFAILESLDIFVDISLKRFTDVYPAAGGFQNGFKTNFNELTSLFNYPRCDVAAEILSN